jgi:hypothetical protein
VPVRSMPGSKPAFSWRRVKAVAPKRSEGGREPMFQPQTLQATARQANAFDFRLRTRGAMLPIYDLPAGGPKLRMKSSAKDEVKKKEAGHYSGLSMRTKRLNQRFAVARPRTFCWMRRRRPRLTSHTEHCVSAYQRWD